MKDPELITDLHSSPCDDAPCHAPCHAPVSLLDYFAAKAMAALIIAHKDKEPMRSIAVSAYDYAFEMIFEKKELTS